MDKISLFFKISCDFSAAVLTGFLMGYGLDYLCQLFPLFIIIFTFLGIITGSFNIYKNLQDRDNIIK